MEHARGIYASRYEASSPALRPFGPSGEQSTSARIRWEQGIASVLCSASVLTVFRDPSLCGIHSAELRSRQTTRWRRVSNMRATAAVAFFVASLEAVAAWGGLGYEGAAAALGHGGVHSSGVRSALSSVLRSATK